MTARPSDRALAGLGVAAAALAATLLYAAFAPAGDRREGQRLVAELGLTDLALFTEARYTRHPSQAEYHAPFQEGPGAPDLFPTGSFIDPHAYLDRAAALSD